MQNFGTNPDIMEAATKLLKKQMADTATTQNFEDMRVNLGPNAKKALVEVQEIIGKKPRDEYGDMTLYEPSSLEEREYVRSLVDRANGQKKGILMRHVKTDVLLEARVIHLFIGHGLTACKMPTGSVVDLNGRLARESTYCLKCLEAEI